MADVSSVKIDFAAKTAMVTMKPGKHVDRQTVDDALRAKGYGVTSFEKVASSSNGD